MQAQKLQEVLDLEGPEILATFRLPRLPWDELQALKAAHERAQLPPPPAPGLSSNYQHHGLYFIWQHYYTLDVAAAASLKLLCGPPTD